MYHFQNYSHFKLNANTPAAFQARKVSRPFEKRGPGFHSGIPNSLSWILESKTRDSGFRKKKFPELRNPDSLTWAKETYGKIVTY